MSKVLAAVGDALMDMADYLAPLGSFGRSLLSLREFALCLRKLFSSRRKKRGLAIFSPFESVAKLSSPTSIPIAFLLRAVVGFNFTRKAGIPIANRIPLNSQCFDLALNRTMQDDFDCTDFGKQQTVVQSVKPA